MVYSDDTAYMNIEFLTNSHELPGPHAAILQECKLQSTLHSRIGGEFLEIWLTEILVAFIVALIIKSQTVYRLKSCSF